MNVPLIVKYIPKTVDEYIFEDKNKINQIISDPHRNMNHMLLCGRAPGTGKSSLCNLFAKLLKADYKKLNASDERGIDSIRDKVKSFASTQGFNKSSPKIIHLDEADGITAAGQDILRAIMEDYQVNCRFLLTCNNENKIIDPIKSRCNVIRFKNPPKDQIKDRLRFILSQEIKTDDNEAIIDMLIDTYYPSIRNMINAIQHAMIGKELITINDFKHDFDNEDKIYDLIFRGGNIKSFIEARRIWIEGGMDLDDILKFIYRKVWIDSEIKNKKQVLLFLADTEYKMNFCDKEIQFATGMLRMINT